MGSFQQVILIGTLGKNPEVHQFQDGSKVVNFTMATSEPKVRLKNGTEIPERTEWHNIVCNGGAARLAEKYLHKGQQVHVCGKLRTRSYEDKQRVKHYVTEVVVQQITLLGSKPQQQMQQQQQIMQDPRVQQVAQQLNAVPVDMYNTPSPF